MPARIGGVAGPASFQRRLTGALQAEGADVGYGIKEAGPGELLLVIGATRELPALWRARRRGVRIVQRLNGINWIHRRLPTGLRHFLRAELNNLLLRAVRQQADLIVYQSEFTRKWWEREFGALSTESAVIHNGVPLEEFTPQGVEEPPSDRHRLTVIEGNLAGGYQVGLAWATRLAQGLEAQLEGTVELVVVGAASQQVRKRFNGRISWRGVVAPEEIPGLHRSSHLLFASDLHPACPNSVLEALACGHPVAAFATGAIPELVGGAEGAVVPFGADSWQVEEPDVGTLVRASIPVLREQKRYRRAARRRAEREFSLERMVASYVGAFGWS